MIVEGILRPGARITDTEIAMLFGTSRIPVREALGNLCEYGLVVHEARRGYYVRQLTYKQALDLYATRFALDRLAIEQALKRPPSEISLAALKEALSAMAVGVKKRDVVAVIEADLRFHRAVASLSDNHSLVEIYRKVTDPVRPILVRIVPTELETERVSRHQRILEAIAAASLQEAEHALRAHNEYALLLLQSKMSQESHGEPIPSARG